MARFLVFQFSSLFDKIVLMVKFTILWSTIFCARPEKFMTGSRTIMRDLRMMQKTDVNTADKLMTDGQSLMMEAAKTMRDK